MIVNPTLTPFSRIFFQDDYTSGTKVNTAIENNLGINNDSINAIKHITGTEKSCVSFGYESKNYRRILNSFISSSSFADLAIALYDLDCSIVSKKKIWINLEEKYGKETIDKAFEYYNSTTDYFHDENAEKLDDIYYQAMADIDSAIDKDYETSFPIKVLRYEAREAFERLLDNLYPQK